MNRLVNQIVIAGICVAMLPPAFAKKKKKDFDLSKNPLADVNSQQPDKVLFDKAMHALKKGRYDVARLDLQTLLNTYPETEYAMRAKLAVGDTWYREGGSAALTQAENEYKDFITFFPNTPEAAEAQMKVGDIYFQQMEKPDRDPANADQAEQQYRTMLQEFPDSPLVPRAKQRLREVQEVLAQREFEIGEFYASRENWAGAIARLQTVADTYPLFSKADQALITLGDAYATQAQMASHLRLPAKAKAEIVKVYNDRAAAAWDRVVLHYPMAAHVEDAKDRLLAMGQDIPEPTQQEIAESEAVEGSRINVRLKDRALLLVKQGPSTVRAARVGDPSLKDPPPTLAPQIDQENINMYKAAMEGKPLPGLTPAGKDKTAIAISQGEAPPAATNPQPLHLEAIPDASGSAGSTVTVEIPSGTSASAGSGTASAGTGGGTGSDATATIVSAPSSAAAGSNHEPLIKGVGPTNNQPLPAVDKPAEASDQVNDVKGGAPAQIQTGTTASKKKNKKAPYNSKEESSSKHKPKKGVHKLNPF